MGVMTVGELEVEVIKKDIKNIHLGVYPPAGRVRLSAPMDSDNEKIRMFIVSKIPWIRKNQRKFKNKERQSNREFIDRESHYFEGRRYLLNVIKDEKKSNSIVLNKTTIKMTINSNLDSSKRKDLFENWMRKNLRVRLEPVISKWVDILGVNLTEWKIKKMKTKWGSCNQEARRLWFNLELAKVDDYCLDYIVLHELAHLKYRNHGREFTNLLETNMIDWRQRKSQLNDTILEFC